MSILEGVYWISFREPRKSLKADADGSVWGVGPGPRGIDVLDSAALRSRIWLAEKATNGQNFRFRNYETGSLLDGNYQSGGDMPSVVTTRRCTDGQLWDIIPLNNPTAGPIYQIKNVATSTILGQSETTESRCRIILNTPDSQQREGWLIEPVILPTLYSITNISHKLTLRAPSHPNPSDGVSGAVKLLASPEQPTRDYLWMLEYVSLSEAVVRSASHQRFVLDLASDSQGVSAREYHGGPSQRWTVKGDSEEISSLVNTKTGTLLAIQKREVFKNRHLTRLVSAPDGATQWQIRSNPQPPLFWVTIQDQTGAHIAQVDDEPLMLLPGPLHINDHTAQWRFIMAGDGLEYVIENRATGFMFGPNAAVGRNDAHAHWILSSIEPNSVKLINVKSKNLVFRMTDATIKIQQAGHQSYDFSSGVGVPRLTWGWHLKPAYDKLPSFAIVNSYTGRCITNTPIPNIGTVSTTDDVNDFCSQWNFHSRSGDGTVDDLTCILSNKMSGTSLEVCHKDEIRIEAYNDHRQSTTMYPAFSWRFLPLSTHLFALCMHFEPGFLYDPGGSDSQAQNALKDIQSLYWYLVSHRESGFDFISLASSTTEQALEHMTSKSSGTPWDGIQRYLPAEREPTNESGSMVKYIPLADKVSHTTDAMIRVALAFLISQWTESFIPRTSSPRTILSATREDIEKRWGVCLSERALRRCSDRQMWIQIDLQGVYNVDGTWQAGIQGQWLDTPMFRIVIPVEVQFGHVVAQRAMLQSLNQELAVQVRATPPIPVPTPSGNMRLDVIRQSNSKSFVQEPTEPTRPTDSGPYYNETRRLQMVAYNNNLALYNENLALYNGHSYWKLHSADMRVINQLIVLS